MSEAVWNKAFTQGSRALQDRLKKVHAKNPKFQAWMKSSGHGSGESVKQASKEVKPTARVKSLQTKSLQAYGATKGVKVGGEHGSGEMKDTIAPLTRDQHSKVQAAERAAKAAAKAAAPAKTKKPLSKAERMSAIARAVTKAKSKDRFDVPTMNPDDMDHDDLRDLHQSLHVRGTYSEEVEMNEGAKEDAEKVLGGPVKTKPANAPTGKLPYPFRRARNLARQAMKAGKSVTESTTEVSEVNEMNHGKKLAKMIMAKQSQHPIAQNMGEAIKDVADVGEYDYEGDMAKSQLRSILANAKRLHDMLEDTTNLPEWVQSKITLAEDYILTAANYMEGEMNEEVEQVDEKIDLEKAKMGDVIKDFQKSDAPQFKGKSMEKRRQMAIAAKLGAERANEEVEQVEEKYMGFKAVMAAAKKGGARDPAAVAAAIGRKKYGKEKFQAAAAAGKKMGEEVEQVNEMYGGKVNGKRFDYDADPHELENDRKLHRVIASYNNHLDHDEVKAIVHSGGYSRNVKVGKNTHRVEHDDNEFNEEVVTESEGKVAVTPKEKALAAHHGDPKKITYGDVIKARLKSAAAKKMGK